MKTSYMWADPGIPRGRLVTGLSLPLERAIDALRSNGFSGIELMLGDPERFDEGAFAAAVASAGLGVSHVCTGEFFGSYGLSLNHPDRGVRDKALSWAGVAIAMAGRMGCPLGIGRFRGGLWEDGAGPSLERMAESMRRLDAGAAAAGTRILLEPLRPDICSTLNTIEETARFVREAGLGSFGWLLDTDHVGLEQSGAILGESATLGLVHLADSMHAPLGRGNVPFAEYFALLARAGYRGYCSVEVFPDALLGDERLVALMARRIAAASGAVGRFDRS